MIAAPNPDLLRVVRPETDGAAGIVARRLADAKTHAAAGNLPTANRRLSDLTESLIRQVADTRGHFYQPERRPAPVGIRRLRTT